MLAALSATPPRYECDQKKQVRDNKMAMLTAEHPDTALYLKVGVMIKNRNYET